MHVEWPIIAVYSYFGWRICVCLDLIKPGFGAQSYVQRYGDFKQLYIAF